LVDLSSPDLLTKIILMEKRNLRIQKYGGWILVNFVICIIPLLISAIISQKMDDNVITSYISFIYTILISGLYIYRNSKNENELIFWVTIIFTFSFLCSYILFPKVFPENINNYIRNNSIMLSSIILVCVLLFSIVLSYKDIESQIERSLVEKTHENASKIENNVKDIFQQLKSEEHEN